MFIGADILQRGVDAVLMAGDRMPRRNKNLRKLRIAYYSFLFFLLLSAFLLIHYLHA